MKITYKGDYALKAVLELALNYQCRLVRLQDMSRRLDIPVKFLEQILLDLKRGGFLSSRRGKAGGYFLARPPSEISLGAVAGYIDGPLEPIACVKDCYSGCRQIKDCVFRPIWHKISVLSAGLIDNISFQDLVEKSKTSSKVSYSI